MAMTVPEKLPETVEDLYFWFLQPLLPFFIMVMYILPLYRTTYRIVAEKESRTKESMRIMGMSDTAYWLSWLTYYSIVNSIIAGLNSALLSRFILLKTDFWILYCAVWLYG
jgi:hypothetical protein